MVWSFLQMLCGIRLGEVVGVRWCNNQRVSPDLVWGY